MSIRASHDDSFTHVPTAAELYHQQLSEAVERNKKGEPTVYRLKPEGQQMILDAMQHNAERGRALDDANRS
jgi:hypothetical protein